MKRYSPKILTFSPAKQDDYRDMEDVIASYSLEGWEIVSMTHLQGMQPVYTVLLQYEISEEEYQKSTEKSA
ncbi:hypothetical protein [Henriciella pelagia]|uniref:hypothetical protein n=1 Tax=Henriciella pelagia TaxID=1977912 RepID=UPI00351300FD